MKLSIFDYIKTAVDILEKEKPNFEKTAIRLSEYLEKSLAGKYEEVVAVTSRIKTLNSLKEKIVRNSLYKIYSAEELVYKVSDIVGIRIECRFLVDEKKIYEILKNIFYNTDDGIYFYNDDKKQLKLKLGVAQPEQQKNGNEIYRIDGFLVLNGISYNFELQIKSLVNSFWSEIEHKIIYKNKRFMMIDNFVTELMGSINENLINIDRQLNMLFNRCLDNSLTIQQKQVENLMIVFINDIYSTIVERSTGFSVSIKNYSESLAKYIFTYSSFKNVEADEAQIYGGTVMNLLNWMKNIDYDNIGIGEDIHFEENFNCADEYEKIIIDKLLENINEDFFNNTFFHILFSIETGDDMSDFMSYVKYYKMRLWNNTIDVGKFKNVMQNANASKMLLEEGILKIQKDLIS